MGEESGAALWSLARPELYPGVEVGGAGWKGETGGVEWKYDEDDYCFGASSG
jgi:hypothetical protein